MHRSRHRIAALAALLLPVVSSAQSLQMPPSAVLTNYDRVLIGQQEALESGAYVARVADSTAGWYNPAGLALVKRSIIDGSSTGYELNIIDLGAIQTSGGKVTLVDLPSFFGVVLGGEVLHSEHWRIGLSITKPTAWGAALNGATVAGSPVVYSSRVSISTLVPTVSVAWAPWPFLRFGAGIGAAITNISQTQILSIRGTEVGQANAALRTLDLAGSTTGAQATVGAQWDISDHFAVGACLRTPTLAITQGGSIAYQAMSETGSPWNQVYFRDPGASFAYKLPLDVTAGLAWRDGPWEAEVDLKFHSAIGKYEIFGSTQKVELVTTNPDGTPVHTYTDFPGLHYGAGAVWNVSVGGHYRLNQEWSFHAGFYTDLAPIDSPGTNIFRSVNLFGTTLGARLRGDHLSGSLGLGFTWGDSDDFPLPVPGEQGIVTTKLTIRTISLLYALAYSF